MIWLPTGKPAPVTPTDSGLMIMPSGFPLHRVLTYLTSRTLQKCQSDFWSQVVKDIAASARLPPWSASLGRASYHIRDPSGSPSGKLHMVPESLRPTASACQAVWGSHFRSRLSAPVEASGNSSPDQDLAYNLQNSLSQNLPVEPLPDSWATELVR